MLFSVLSADMVPKWSSATKAWKPSSLWHWISRLRTVSGLPITARPTWARFSTVRPADMIELLAATIWRIEPCEV